MSKLVMLDNCNVMTDTHPPNDPCPKLVNDGKDTVIRLVHPLNAFAPSDVALGSLIYSSLAIPENMLSGPDVSSGKSMNSIAVQPSNASYPTVMTLRPMNDVSCVQP